MPENLQDQIHDNASGPAKVTGDAGSIEQHPLKDQIEADKYLASKASARSKRPGIRLGKIIPPGASGC